MKKQRPSKGSPFQFLIGSLEAVCTISKLRLAETTFQFLIGSLEAELRNHLQMQVQRFQFLIGSLEAGFRTRTSESTRVSIPHRQSGSKMQTQKRQVIYLGFNSSQVVWKPGKVRTAVLNFASFNSSQVVWKQKLAVSPLPAHHQVSIPHRQSGSEFQHMIEFQEQLFQFLIGSLEASYISSIVYRTRVSIPHRQSGSEPEKDTDTSFERFNSSQVVWKRHYYLFRINKIRFNSSQVVWKQSSGRFS